MSCKLKLLEVLGAGAGAGAGAGGHSGRIDELAFNPESGKDGVPAEIASCGADGTVRIWRHITGTTNTFCCEDVLKDESTGENMQYCVWSPNGKLLATSTMLVGETTIWENVGGRYEKVYAIESNEESAPCISWNTSGTLLATCALRSRIWIWRVLSSKEFDVESVVLDSLNIVHRIKWHPLKDILFSSGFDSTIKIWEENVDGGEWNVVQTLGDPYSDDVRIVEAFAFNVSGDKIAAVNNVGTIKIWGSEIKKTKTGEENTLWTCLCTLAGYHDLSISSIGWSRDGIICSGSFDKTMCFFVESKDEFGGPMYKLLLKHRDASNPREIDAVTAVQWFFMGKNRCLASADMGGRVKIWELVFSSSTI